MHNNEEQLSDWINVGRYRRRTAIAVATGWWNVCVCVQVVAGGVQHWQSIKYFWSSVNMYWRVNDVYTVLFWSLNYVICW